MPTDHGLEDERRRAVLLRAIEAISRSLTTSLDLDEVLDTIAHRALEVMDAESVLIASGDGQAPSFRVMRAVGRLSEAYAATGFVPVGGGPGSRAVLESRAVTTANILTDPSCALAPDRRAQIEREGYRAVAAAPLASKGRVHGALIVHYWEERTFTDEERSALVLLAGHAALAIDGAQLFAEAGRRAQRLRELSEVQRLVSSSLELSDVLTRIARSTARLVGVPIALVWTVEPGERVIHRRAISVEPGLSQDGIPLALAFGEGIGGRVAETRRRMFVADVTREPRMMAGDWALRADLTVLLAVPIEAGDQLLGVLTVAGRTGALAAEEDHDLVASLAALAGVALQNAGVYAQAIRRAARLHDLVAVSQSITASLDTKDVVQRIAAAAGSIAAGALAAVHVHDAERDTLRFAATSGGSVEGVPEVHPSATGLPGLVVERREPVLIADPVNHERTLMIDWWRQRPTASYYGVPIVVGETFMGVLGLILPAGPPDREEQEALQLLAAQAGVAIRNAALYQAERELTERTRTLAAISRRISAALDLDELLRTIAESAAQLTGTRFVAFWLADDATRTLSLRGGSDPEVAEDFPETSRSYDVGVAGWVARHRTSVNIPDVSADPRIVPREWWSRWGFRSFSAHPVLAGDELLAVLSMSHSEPIEFSRQTREVLDLFVAQAAVAIQNARLYRAVEGRRDVAEALVRLGRDLTGSLDHAHIAGLVAQGLVEVLGSRNSAVFSLEPDGSLRVLAWFGADAELLRGVVLAPGEGVAGRVVAERRILASKDVLHDPAVQLSEASRARLVRFSRRAIVGAPLIARDQVIGAVVMADHERDYRDEELQVFQAFADHAALALDNARLYAAARESLDRLRETQGQLVQAGKLSALGQLVSGVAHELNNPLSVIIGYGQLLSNRELPANLRRPIELIVQQGDRMAKIVHNLLYFSRQRPPERTRLDLHEIIEQTLALRVHQLMLQRIVVEREFAPALPLITGDAHQLQQVFLNLLLNAEQAITGTARAEGRIAFRTSVAEDGRTVRAAVVDDGPGIDPDTLPRVFEPFFTTKDVGVGTGLGLSVSYGIAQEHRGRLTVESRPGETVFTLELPADVAPAVADDAVAVDAEPAEGRGRRALIVEDEPSVRDFIVVLLEETGWVVDTADGGRAALARLREHAYALIVSDIRMPDGNGADLFRGVLAHDRALAERFVFITGDTANPAAWAFLEGTAAPVLEKPFPNTAFLDAVRRVATREGH